MRLKNDRLRVILVRILILAAALLVSRSGSYELPLQGDRESEIRALWVDGYHHGIRTAQEVDRLVLVAKQTGFNTLIVQVRLNADSYYTRTFESPVEDYAYDPRFDALDYVITRAHREGLEVHAWINALPVWRSPDPPIDPKHLFYEHGPSTGGMENWLTCSQEGKMRYPAGYYLDPGHPVAAEYIAAVYLNIVRNYAVDGIHFDYIRYPETGERLPRGASVGYNPVSLQRYRSVTGREVMPAPGDPEWSQWRRLQVTQLVRRIYIEAKEINRNIKVSAALVAWGTPPTSPEDFLDTTPGQRVFQDWNGWLQEGILDLAVPMNYIRDGDPLTRDWFDGWIQWEKRYKHGRQLAVGIGAYLNTPGSTFRQIALARRPVDGHRADGISVFSYAILDSLDVRAESSHGSLNTGFGESAPPVEAVAYLSTGTRAALPPFELPAQVPPMIWLDNPEKGMLAGIMQDGSGRPLDGSRLFLKRTGLLSLFRRTLYTETDGNGFFGFVQLDPGQYRLRFEDAQLQTREMVLEIRAGEVTRVEPGRRSPTP